jgi:microsomal dipeptidase-like Zn-dependent dipeptidase
MERMIRWRRFYESSGKFLLGLKPGDAERARKQGKTAMFIAWQDIGPLEGRIDLLDAFYDLGLRVVQPTYQRRSLAGDGCGERNPAGLSLFGIELVRRCNKLGIGLDVSHVSEPTTLDMVAFSDAPVLATHVCASGVNQNIRNKTDREIKEIAAKGGLIGVVGKSGFLRSDGLEKGTTLEDYVDHIAYICDLVGPNHVCIGTDIADERKYSKAFLLEFNRNFPENKLVDETMKLELIHPADLQSPRYLGNITEALLRRQFAEDDVRKIIGGNAERVIARILTPGK